MSEKLERCILKLTLMIFFSMAVAEPDEEHLQADTDDIFFNGSGRA